MKTIVHIVLPEDPCGYLPDQVSQMENEIVAELSPAEYEERLLAGWRRFGWRLFRPRCRTCTACHSLRVDVQQFRPNRSQRRNRKLNQGTLTLQIGEPQVTEEKLELHDRYHQFQTDNRDWPVHDPANEDEYFASFVNNPLPTEEWCYFLGERLVGVGYVDVVPSGLSAIYYFYDPGERQRGLGTWNVLSVIDEAARRQKPHVYLGYWVEGCRSVEYKADFRPNHTRIPPEGPWQRFR